MERATIQNAAIDYVLMTRAALAKAEKLSDDIESIPTKVQSCREAWRDYGAGLLAQRKLMPNKNEFGAWVKANGLDTGRAALAVTRSDAIWVAENWDRLSTVLTQIKNHHPTGIRQECRAAGYEWAGGSVRKAKQISTLGWAEAAEALGPLPLAHHTIVINKPAIENDCGFNIPRRVDVASEWPQRIRNAIETWYSKGHPDEAQQRATVERATLSETAQAKLDRIMQKEIALLRTQFQTQVDAAANAKAEVVTEGLRRFYRKGIEEAEIAKAKYERYAAKLNGIMSREEYRVVLGCLHPDRPERSPQALGRAFEIFKRLEQSVKWGDR